MELETLINEAQGLSKARRWSEALEAWEKVRGLAPRNGELWFRVAEAELGLGNFTEAQEALDTHDSIIRKSVRATSLRARILSESGQFSAAKDSWRAVLAAVPDNFQAWARLAEATILLGERTAGRAALRRALSIRPDDSFINRLQRRVTRDDRVALRKAMGGKAAAGSISLNAPTPGATQLFPGLDGASQGLIEPGRKAPRGSAPVQKVSAKAAKAYTVEQALGLSGAENWTEAAAAWLFLMDAQPRNEDVCLQAWEALHQTGRLAEATQALIQGFERASRSIAVFEDCIERASDFSLPGSLAEGLFTFASVPGRPEALTLQSARSLKRFGATGQAVAVLERAIGTAPGVDRLSAELCKMLFEQRDFMGLTRSFADMVNSGPPQRIDGAAATISYQLGLALLASSRVADAAKFIDHAWSIRPVGVLALRAKGTLLVRQHKIDELTEAVRSAFRQVAPLPWPWIEGLRLLIEDELVEAAEAMLRDAFEALNDNGEQSLVLASRINQVELDDQLLERLPSVKASTTKQLVTASTIALRRGATSLAADFLDKVAGDDRAKPDVTAQAARIALAESILSAYPQSGDWRFEDAVFWRIGQLIYGTKPYTSENGPIILLNTAMGAGGAERQVAATLAGLARTFGGPERLKLVCSRLTDAPDRRLNLPPVTAAGVEILDLSSAPSATGFLFEKLPELKELFGLLVPEISEDVARMYRAFVTMRPAVVHLWQDRTSVDGGIAAIMAGVPSIVMVARSTRPVSRRRFRSYLRGGYASLLSHPNVILANNSFAGAADYESWLGLEKGKVSVIHNGFDFDSMKHRATPQAIKALREKYDLQHGLPVLGGVLRFSQVKRPLLWLEVARLVMDAVPDLRLLLLGEGPLEGAVREHAKKLGLSERLLLPGFVDPAPHLPLMSASLLTSVTEGLPNALLEAQAFGVPAISTNAGGARETVIEGVTGFISDDSSPKALAERVIKAISDEAWRAIACPRAESLALERFGMKAMLDKTLALYDTARSKSQ